MMRVDFVATVDGVLPLLLARIAFDGAGRFPFVRAVRIAAPDRRRNAVISERPIGRTRDAHVVRVVRSPFQHGQAVAVNYHWKLAFLMLSTCDDAFVFFMRSNCS